MKLQILHSESFNLFYFWISELLKSQTLTVEQLLHKNFDLQVVSFGHCSLADKTSAGRKPAIERSVKRWWMQLRIRTGARLDLSVGPLFHEWIKICVCWFWLWDSGCLGVFRIVLGVRSQSWAPGGGWYPGRTTLEPRNSGKAAWFWLGDKILHCQHLWFWFESWCYTEPL